MTTPVQQLFDLSSRVAIVTGGSRGLGQEMAEGLAEAGASLMLCARRDEWLTPTVDAMRARGFTRRRQRVRRLECRRRQAVVVDDDRRISAKSTSWSTTPA